MAESNIRGKQLEKWTKTLFEELGYTTAPKGEQGFHEIVYAKRKRTGEYGTPMFQVDVQYWNWLGEKVICECKNYGNLRDLNLEETLLKLLALTELSGSARGRLILPARVATKERKEEQYRGVIEICDIGVLERLDAKRRRRHPLRYLLKKQMPIVEQVKAVQVDSELDYRRHYYRFPKKVNRETMKRYRAHLINS